MAKRKKKVVKFDGNPYGDEPIWNVGETPTDPKARTTEWLKAASWYNYDHSLKEYIPYIVSYAKDILDYSKDDIKALKRLPDWMLTSEVAKLIRLHYRGWEYTAKEREGIAQKLALKLEYAKNIKVEEESDVATPVAPVISVQERQKQKVNDTICNDYDTLWDEFDAGNFKATINAFSLCQTYAIKGSAINIFREVVAHDLEPIADAYNKTCKEAVEAYSHFSRPNLKKVYDTLTAIIEDLDKVKMAAKSTRAPRAKKPKAAEKQVAKLVYKADDTDYKVASINPIMIPSKSVLWAFNTKTRVLTMFKADSVEGLSVSGSTIKGFNAKISKCTTLRKPLDVLPTVLKATPKKVEKVWDDVTTKVREPKGRINKDTILLRVI